MYLHHCLSESADGICYKCEVGFYLTSASYCKECTDGCVNCLHENYCIECRENYFLPIEFVTESKISIQK